MNFHSNDFPLWIAIPRTAMLCWLSLGCVLPAALLPFDSVWSQLSLLISLRLRCSKRQRFLKMFCYRASVQAFTWFFFVCALERVVTLETLLRRDCRLVFEKKFHRIVRSVTWKSSRCEAEEKIFLKMQKFVLIVLLSVFAGSLARPAIEQPASTSCNQNN